MVNKFDLVGYFNNYCLENHIYYIAGEKEYQNALADYNLYNSYQLILCTDLNLSPYFTDTGVESVTYSGTLFLGRKKELTTVSTLDETFYQKYTARLLDLTEMIVSMLESLQCEQDATINSCTINYALNQYDLNVDGVACDVSIKFE